jgi:hypothetical protein
MSQQIEPLILDAWKRLGPAILSNPKEVARRLARRHSATLTRPPRAWCLAVRASDTRIGVSNARIEPEYATDPNDPDHRGMVVEHTLTLDAPLLRELCRPVRLEPGGELWDHAAAKLGTTYCGLRHARATGRLEQRHIRRLLGRPGKPVPIISAPDSLDPCAHSAFEMPDPLFTGREPVARRIPNDLCATLTRVPNYRPTTYKHQYDDNAHPEMTEPPLAKPRPCLPPPAPDYVWYKWSTSGEYLGDDKRYWRTRPDDPGTPPPHAA